MISAVSLEPALSAQDERCLQEVIGWLIVSPRFRDEFARDAVAAILAAKERESLPIDDLSQPGQHLLARARPRTWQELAELVEGMEALPEPYYARRLVA